MEEDEAEIRQEKEKESRVEEEKVLDVEVNEGEEKQEVFKEEVEVETGDTSLTKVENQ